jgi:hypothetical protein
MSEKVLAKDAKAGQWYEDRNGDRSLCVYEPNNFVRKDTGVFGFWSDEKLTHLPDCTGWDWQPPKPEKKYREFVTFGEWWPHRNRWVQHQQYVHMNYWESQSQAKKWFDDGAVFLNDDGGDGEPFGVEILPQASQ